MLTSGQAGIAFAVSQQQARVITALMQVYCTDDIWL